MSRAKNADKNRPARRRNWQTNRNGNTKQIRDAMNWLLTNKSFEDLAFHGNTSWCPSDLIVLTLLWIWSASPKLTDAFEDARCQSHQLLGKSSLTTYQGLAGALQTWTATFMSGCKSGCTSLSSRLVADICVLAAGYRLRSMARDRRRLERSPMSKRSVPRTTAKGRLPSIAKRRRKGCGVAITKRQNRNRKHLKSGSR